MSDKVEAHILNTISDKGLKVVFEESESYRNTGILPEGVIRSLARDLKETFSLPLPPASINDLVIQICLREIARRWIASNQD